MKDDLTKRDAVYIGAAFELVGAFLAALVSSGLYQTAIIIVILVGGLFIQRCKPEGLT